MTKKKILYVVNEAHFFYSHRLDIAKAAVAEGFDVHLAVPTDNVWAPKDFSVAALESHGITIHELPLSRRGVNPFEEMKTFLSLLKLYKGLRPNLVHLITIKPILYGGLAARLCGVSAVVYAVPGLGHLSVAKDPFTKTIRWCVRALMSMSLKHGNATVIVQNPDDLSEITRFAKIPSDRISLIRGSGIPLDRYACRPETMETPLIILPARLIWEKGVGDFVAAARLLRDQGVDARFALLGNTHPSNKRAVPEAQLKKWDGDGDIEWWGRREDMPDVYASAHIVCLPSRYGEGVPRSLLEAAACGRAIVTTDIPGCREAVRAGETGLLVPQGDIAALSDALKTLIERPELRQRLGAAGRLLAEAEFSIERVVSQTLQIYQVLFECKS